MVLSFLLKIDLTYRRLLEHASFKHSLVSLGLPVQEFPDVQFLVRLSVPRPHVTEHDQRPQDDQTTKE